ncbi:hypothetical protein [Mobilicoccus pelagius]|nr:hypothetical protein [Mobilicoccus pelagius]
MSHTADVAGAAAPEPVWPLWEVFVRVPRSLSHVHAGSVHAPDDATALRHARALYAPRQDGVSVWVVPSAAITTAADVAAQATHLPDAAAATWTREVPPCR